MVNRQRTEIYSRVVGYIRPVSQWNTGQVSMWNDRKFFNINKNGTQNRKRKTL